MARRSRIDMAWRKEAARAGAGRLRRPPARQKRGLNGPTILYAICLGLLLGWYGPDIWASRATVWADLRQTVSMSPPVASPSTDTLSASFGFCHNGGGTHCVVDGDTFWFQGGKYRIADIDTPETHGPRCAEEAALGARATTRLQELMNAGPFTLESGARDTDRYGRALRIVTRDGASIGQMLVAEGLARPWRGSRQPWC